MNPSIMHKRLTFRMDYSSNPEWILTQTSRKIHFLSCISLLKFGKNAFMIRNILETKAVSRQSFPERNKLSIKEVLVIRRADMGFWDTPRFTQCIICHFQGKAGVKG